MNGFPVSQLISTILFGTAGLCIFVMLLNRFFFHVPDSKPKHPLIIFSLLAISGGFAVFGFFFHGFPWLFFPLAIFCLMAIGEMRQKFIRQSCAGTMPVDTIPHDIDFKNPITTTDLVVHRYEVPHAKRNDKALRIVHLTDLHIHDGFPMEYYREVISLAEQAKPDIAVFTGDFVKNPGAIPKLQQILRPIARIDTFAVLGNHDFWIDAMAISNAIRESGIHLLSDETVNLSVDSQQIAVTGYDHPWGRRESHIPAQDNRTLHIVLSHTPDNIYRASASSADFVFSGHYHAGQIRFPILGPVVIPSAYGRRFDHGHFVVNGTHLFVASGVGAASPSIRIYCQPDIFIVDIVPN